MENKASIITAKKSGHYPSAEDVYYCVGSKEKAKIFKEDGAEHLPWDQAPEAAAIKKTTALRLLPNKGQVSKGKFPAYVKDMERLSFLEIPLPYVAIIKQEDLPKGLKTLMISNTADYTEWVTKQLPAWPDIVLPELKALIFFNEMGCAELTSLLHISQKHVPSLEYLEVRLDKKGEILKDIAQFTTLRHLELEFAGKHDIFSAIRSPLEALAVIGAEKEFPVEQLTKLTKLQTIWLNSIKAVIDCNIFTQLPDLLELQIINSKKVEKADALLECKQLKNIVFVNCNDPFKKIKQQFAPQRYELLDIMYA